MEIVHRSDGIAAAVRKRRSRPSRRPKPDHSDDNDDNSSSDDNNGGNPRRKKVNVNHFAIRVPSSVSRVNNTGDRKEIQNSDAERRTSSNNRSSEGVLSPANRKTSKNDIASESKVKKVKLKVGGVTRTIQANSAISDWQEVGLSSSSLGFNNVQGNLGNPGLKGIPWKDFPRGGFRFANNDSGSRAETVRKSKRGLKKQSLDGDFGDDYEDDEIRFLEKLKNPKPIAESSMDEVDYDQDKEFAFESKEEAVKRKKTVKELPLTTRQRTPQHSVEFPEGLPPASSRKQKEKVAGMELQMKKAEAAERRRLHNEKVARKSEAEAIRKILGQDSGRKKREEKLKRRLEVMAQEKVANSLTVASNTIRWAMKPTGTVVTFPADVGLPSLFSHSSARYPPLRETCAGPACTNPYRYRDSKSNQPLCSLQCYKAIQL